MTESASTQTAEKPRRPWQTRIFIGGAVVVLGAGLTAYFVRNHYYPGTNDAYVHAYTMTHGLPPGRKYKQYNVKYTKNSPKTYKKKGKKSTIFFLPVIIECV